MFFLLCRWPLLPHSPLLRPSAPLRVPCPQGSPSPRRTAPLLRPHKIANPTLNRTSSPAPQHGPNSCLQTRQQTSNLTTFRINTCKSVSKQTTLTPFRMNTYEKHRGEGVAVSVATISICSGRVRFPQGMASAIPQADSSSLVGAGACPARRQPPAHRLPRSKKHLRTLPHPVQPCREAGMPVKSGRKAEIARTPKVALRVPN